MKPGDVVRIVAGPWSERIGCTGTVVDPQAHGGYPQPTNDEVLVRLDADPLHYDGAPDWWSCAINRNHLEYQRFA